MFRQVTPVTATPFGRERKAAEYTCYGAWVSVKCRKVLEDKLEAAGMKRLMNEMEMPLSLVLYDMQKEGVAVRREELKSYGDALVARIEELEHAIHEQAGVDFNINSPKQLGEVLFETMQDPGREKDEDRLFYRSGCAGEVVCGLSDCAGYSGVQRTYKTEIQLWRTVGSFYRGGWKNSYELQSDHYSHRADQFHRTESAEHSHAYGTGQKDPQGICPQGGI